MDQDIRILKLHRHLLGVGDEVGREIATIELHALDHVEFELDAGCFLDGDHALRSSTTRVTARSMPRLRSIGFTPAETDFMPSRTIAWARTVAVVVPSPAMSLVFEATSRTICAPMFSNLSFSSISLATVTPSLVMRGAPKLLSMTTLRPLGPSVTLTALARISTPLRMRSRASR